MPTVPDFFALVPAVSNTGIGFAALLHTLRRDRRSDTAASAVATRDSLAAHLAFHQAAVSVLHRLQYLSATGLPPSWTGILWSWPASVRATREFPTAIEALHLTFSAAAITGPVDLLDASAALFAAIGESCSGFATRQQPGKAEFDRRLAAAYEEFGSYVSTLRERLAAVAD
jgi:hypothetical protein